MHIGVNAVVATGRLAMVSWPRAGKQPRGELFETHAWAVTDGGVCDFSLRVSTRHGEWADWRLGYALENHAFGVPETRLHLGATERAYETLIALASHAESQYHIVYFQNST
jgi:hypothetical protein